MIDKEKIDAIKRNIELVSLIESRGVKLKKQGGNYVGLCPFHNDKKASFTVNPVKNLWNCFGCGAGGSVIDFVMKIDNIEFYETAQNLLDSHGIVQSSPSKSKKHKSPELPEEKFRQLVERAVTIYEKGLSEYPEGGQYFEHRKISDVRLLDKYRAGYCNGRLNELLPKSGAIHDELKAAGILLKNGRERFEDCVVFPVHDVEGNISTLYGRYINDGRKAHIFLPNRQTGLWNAGIIKTYPEIILTESIFDALSIITAGYFNVISINGTNGLKDCDIKLFKEYGVRKVIFMLDGDEPGTKAIEQLKERLSDFSCEIKRLPENHDPNSFLVKYGSDKLAEFIKTKAVKKTAQTTKLQENVKLMPDGFVVSYGSRQYRIIGLEKGVRKIKASVRMEHAGKLHVDTLDFYSARARRSLAQDICRLFNEVPETIEADINRLLLECERISKEKEDVKALEQKTEIPPMTAEDIKEAEEFGRSPDLINRILSDFEACGLIGEEHNKILGYIAITSRKRNEPLALLILASYGAGKTILQDRIVDFCPPEDLVKVTSLSGKALFYKQQMSLKNKVLALEEGNGAEDASYAIRSLISSGVLITESTIKDLSTGKLTTMQNRVEGPTSVFYTTTNPDGDPETKSRFFVLGLDESREQTRKIQTFQRKKQMDNDLADNMEIEAVKKKHWNFQRLLKPVGVKNPYADKLSYEDDRLQGRRDQPKYLALIKNTAFLRQMRKEIEYEYKHGKKLPFIKVDLEDIRIANELSNEILGKSLDELSRPGRDLLMLLDEMVEQSHEEMRKRNKDYKSKRTAVSFTRRDIREFSGWSNSRIHRYLKELVEMEYILVTSGRNGLKYRYRLAYEGQGKNGEKFMLGLKEAGDLKDVEFND